MGVNVLMQMVSCFKCCDLFVLSLFFYQLLQMVHMSEELYGAMRGDESFLYGEANLIVTKNNEAIATEVMQNIKSDLTRI